MIPGDREHVWQFVLYDKTASDIRGWYSVRPVVIDRGTHRPWRINCISRTLEPLREPFDGWLHWMPRFPEDAPVILGVWM